MRSRPMPKAEYVSLTREIRSVLVPDCYRYVPAPRWRWLQDLAWAFLMRAGALQHTHRDEETLKVRQIDVAKLSHLVLDQWNTAADMSGQLPSRIIMGDRDFAELMRESGIEHYASFQSRTYQGMRIEIVPWMRGVIVLP